MVQKEPSLALILEALGGFGALLSTEVKAALAHSIPLKKAECCLPNMAIWGRISTLNGRDYIIAQSTPNPRMESGAAVPSTLYFVTQDGVTWADLPDATPAHHDIAAHMRDMLQGDPTHKHFWPPKPAEDDEEAAGGDEGAPRAEHKAITELQRLRTMIEDIAASTTLAPVGSQVVNADDCIIANPLFPGLEYPDKLEAYYHQHRGPNSPSAAEDVRGSWAIRYDTLKQVAVVRSLLFLGYSFFYDGAANTWGGFYNGDGLKNVDLIFML